MEAALLAGPRIVEKRQAGGEASSYAGEYETPQDMQGMPTEVDVRCLATLAPKEAAGKGKKAQLQHPVTPDLPSGGEQPSSSGAEDACPDQPEENMDGLAQTLVQAIKNNPTVIRALLSSLSKEALAAAMGSREPVPQASPSPSSAPAHPQERPAHAQERARSLQHIAGGASASAAGQDSGMEQGFSQEASQYPYAGHVEQLKAATQIVQSNRGQHGGPLRHVPGQPRWQPTAAIQSRGAVRPASAGAARTAASPRPVLPAEPARPGSANPTTSMQPFQLGDLAATPQRVHRRSLHQSPPVYQQPAPAPQPRSASRPVPPPPAATPHRPISHQAFQEEEREFEEREFQERIMEERIATARRTPPAHADCTLAGAPAADAAVAEAGLGCPHPDGEEGGEPLAAGSTANDAKPCKCKKSRCLKLYCDCFATGLFCNDACLCQDCENRTETLSAVFKARQFIMVKDPAAFKPKVTDATGGVTAHVKGCACRKSRCLKKYCECFLVGVRCTENCRCVACLNNGSGPGDIGAALVQGSVGTLAAPPQQAPLAGSEQHPEGAAGPSAPRLPPRDRAPAPVFPGSREFTVPARTGAAHLPVTDDPMGGWGIPGHTHESDVMARPAGLSASLPGRTSLRRPGLPIWNSVGQQISTGRPTMAGTLLQQNMSELMTEVKGRTAQQSRPERPSADAPHARQEQAFSDVPAADAEQGEEVMGDEGHLGEDDHREFDEEVRMMALDDMGRRSRRALEQAGADLAPQSAADNESHPMDNGRNSAAGHVDQEIKNEDEDAVFAHPSQLALQEDIADLEQGDRLAHAPERNISPQHANLTHPNRHLSPRRRNLGLYDADLGPRAPGPQKRDLDAHARTLSSQDREIRSSGSVGQQNHSRGRGNAHLDPHDREWVPGEEKRGQRATKLAQHGREQWHAEEPERDLGPRHRDISPHKRHRGEYLGPRDRDLSPHNRRNPGGYPGRQDSDLSQHNSGVVQQLDRDISRNHGEDLGQQERGVSQLQMKGRGGRDQDWSPRDATPERARPRGRRGGKRERATADPDPSYSGRSADGVSAEPVGRQARRASTGQETQEEEGLGLRWGVRKKVTISRVPEAWRDQQAAQQVPSGGSSEEAELAQGSAPSHQRILSEMQQLGRSNSHKRAAFPAPKPEEGTPPAGGAAPGPQPPRRPTERLADTESDAAEALLSFL